MGEALEHDGNLIQVAEEAVPADGVVFHRSGAVHWPVLERLLDVWPLRVQAAFASTWGLKIRVERGVLSTGRIRKADHALEQYALRGVIGRDGQRDAGLLVVEPVCLFGVLEFVLGDRASIAPGPLPTRPANPFEASLMRPLANVVIDTFSSCLAGAGTLNVGLQRWLSPGDEFADAPALIAPLTLHFGEKTGIVALILPFSLLAPLAPALGGILFGDDPASAEAWRLALHRRVLDADVTLTAVLHEATVPFAAVHDLSVGKILTFDAPADPVVGLFAGPVRIAEGSLGRAGPRVAIRLTSPVFAGKGTA
jgi:flagellar motor switch protein FliM